MYARIVLGVMVLVLAMFLFWTWDAKQHCEAAGDVMVRTLTGLECIRVQRAR